MTVLATPHEYDQTGKAGVSIIIRHQVSVQHHAEYENWLKLIIPAAAKFPGHQGVNIVRPSNGGQQFEIAVRFASEELAHGWLKSEQRKALIEQSIGLFHEQEILEIYNGIDFWFTSPSPTNKVATRWKQWLLTTAIIWPLTLVVPMLLQPLLSSLSLSLPMLLRQGLVVSIVVALVVYLIMPRVVKLVAPWLFR